MTSSASQTTQLRRYTRPREEVTAPPQSRDVIPFAQSDAVIAASALSPGSKALLRGLLRVGTAREFPGGGAGIEYGSLLKTAARPDYIAAHVEEAAAHLAACQTDLLLVPGMSGYPVGAMYALAARIPALLLKKSRLDEANPHQYPTGAFVIPSYTGEGEVVMHADPAAAADIVECLVERKLAEQADRAEVEIELRVAGADDIIDKATMSQAVSESALAIGQSALENAIAKHRARTEDMRVINSRVTVVAWVTPLIKSYNRPHEHLRKAFGLRPFAGIEVASIQLDPPAVEISGIGTLAFASSIHTVLGSSPSPGSTEEAARG